jgi:subtilase family serine protease
VQFEIKNRGTGTAGASRVKIYLSTDAGLSANDLLLRSRSVAALAPGASQSHAVTEVIPPAVRPGSYYLVLVVDDDSAVRELNERNNVRVVAVTIR